MRARERGVLPGIVRASANRATSILDVDALGNALRAGATPPEDGPRHHVDEHGDHVLREARSHIRAGA